MKKAWKNLWKLPVFFQGTDERFPWLAHAEAALCTHVWIKLSHLFDDMNLVEGVLVFRSWMSCPKCPTTAHLSRWSRHSMLVVLLHLVSVEQHVSLQIWLHPLGMLLYSW
jgi:hypothetical protein